MGQMGPILGAAEGAAGAIGETAAAGAASEMGSSGSALNTFRSMDKAKDVLSGDFDSVIGKDILYGDARNAEASGIGDLAAMDEARNMQDITESLKINEEQMKQGTADRTAAERFFSSMWDAKTPLKGFEKIQNGNFTEGLLDMAKASNGKAADDDTPIQELQAGAPTAGQGMIFDAETELNKLRSRMNQ